MVEEEEEPIPIKKIDYGSRSWNSNLKKVLFEDDFCCFLFQLEFFLTGAVVVGVGIYFGCVACDRLLETYLPVRYEVVNIDLNGNNQPETYVEVGGVKYFSRIDGKELSDLVRGTQ
jgi:hypothetical protein